MAGFCRGKIAMLSFAALLFSVQLCFGLNVVSYVTNSDGVTFTCNSEYSGSYEAESASLSGGAVTATDHTGYSGSGFVAGYYNSTTAQTSFTVTVPSSGQYQMQLRYSAGNGTSANTGLYVNGSRIKNITCPVTADWNTWANETDTVTLNSGNNTIAYTAVASSTACINLDNITVTSIGSTSGSTGLMKVQICQADIVRVIYTPTSSFPAKISLCVNRTWSTPAFTTSDVGDTITLQTSRIKAKVSRLTATVTYTDLSNNVVLSEYDKSMAAATVEGISTYTCTTIYNSPTSEGLYGLGQHMIDGGAGATTFNYKGHDETITQEYSGGNHFYESSPVLVSTRGYGLFWDNYSKSWFYGGEGSNTRYRYSSECGDLIDYYFFYGPELDAIVSLFRTATGKVPMLAKWSYGLIQSKDRYSTQAEFLSVKDGYRNNNIPVDCIVQDWQWWAPNPWGSHIFDASRYPDVKSMVDQVHSANIHTMVSIWPSFTPPSSNYTELNNLGALWPVTSGSTRFVDAYHTNGREAYWRQLKDEVLVNHGWDAWWNDNNEPDPYPDPFDRHAITTAMGKGCLYYNTYSLMITTTGYTNWRRDIPGRRASLLSRSAFAGQQRAGTITWNNDISCNFPALANSIPCGLNFCISGNPYWCTDIGGYWGHSLDWTTAANRELFTRWFQYGAFLSIFRIHGGGSRELYCTNWDAATKANLLLIDKLRYRLVPYIYSLAWKVTNEDYTIYRPLVMDYRTDANVYNIGNQFMFGPAFMVSPVTTAGAASRSVYLPAGTWHDFWTGATNTGAAGRTITASAPLSQIPLYVRAGSIVSMGQEIQYATQRSDTIELRVYPGADGQVTLYEDEGDNYNYETGSYATIPITYSDNPRCLTIGSRSGSFTGMLASRIFSVVFVSSGHGTGEPKTANPDYAVPYSGSLVRCGACVGTMPGTAEKRTVNLGPLTIKTAEERVVFPSAFSGKMKEIALYDCSGRLLKKIVTGKQTVDIRKYFALPSGVYIVKVNTAHRF